MDNFTTAVTQNIEEFDGDYRAKISDDERKALGALKTTQTISVGAAIASHSRVTIAKALQMSQESSDKVIPENTDIYADIQRITITDTDGKDKVVDYLVSACKASNIATGMIADEVVVYKAYARLEMSGDTSKNIKTDIKSQDQIIFDISEKEDDPKDEGHIIKKSDTRDTVISTTIVPGSIVFPREFNNANQMSINLRTTLLKRFLEEYKDCDKNTAVAIVRGMNRSYSEDVFERIYTKYFGQLDEGNIEKVVFHTELKNAFLANLQGIGSPSVATEHIRVAMDLRKMSIAPNPKWTKNAGRVKQNSAKFYYVSNSLTTGILNVPTTAQIVKDSLGEINNLFNYSALLLEKETRAENGLKHDSIKLPRMTAIPAVSTQVGDILKITDASFQDVLDVYNVAVVNLAEETCNMANTRRQSEVEDAMAGILGG